MVLTEQDIRGIVIETIDALFAQYYQSKHDGPDIDLAVDIAHRHLNMEEIDRITSEMIASLESGLTAETVHLGDDAPDPEITTIWMPLLKK